MKTYYKLRFLVWLFKYVQKHYWKNILQKDLHSFSSTRFLVRFLECLQSFIEKTKAKTKQNTHTHPQKKKKKKKKFRIDLQFLKHNEMTPVVCQLAQNGHRGQHLFGNNIFIRRPHIVCRVNSFIKNKLVRKIQKLRYFSVHMHEQKTCKKEPLFLWMCNAR